MSCELHTARLVVRLPAGKDAAAIAAFYRENEAHLKEFSPRMPPEMFEERYWGWAAPECRADFEAGRSCRTFLFDSETHVVGLANLSEIVRGPFQAAYLGYALAKSHEGRGVMYEALQALIPYAFDELNLHRIMANYVPWNRRSHQLLERLGFVIEGNAKRYLLIDGRWQDHVMTALTNESWREK
jgi:ribosomal-protein-alanine N-acetyltransferase